MRRRREIAGAPERSTNETVGAISGLVRDSLARGEALDVGEIDAALAVARPALLALVAGGHLETSPLVVMAASLDLSITTLSGERALALEENLSAVSGAASATDWTLYLPTPDPVGPTVEPCAKGHERLSTAEPPAESDAERAVSQSAKSPLDLDALIDRNRR